MRRRRRQRRRHTLTGARFAGRLLPVQQLLDALPMIAVQIDGAQEAHHSQKTNDRNDRPQVARSIRQRGRAIRIRCRCRGGRRFAGARPNRSQRRQRSHIADIDVGTSAELFLRAAADGAGYAILAHAPIVAGIVAPLQHTVGALETCAHRMEVMSIGFTAVNSTIVSPSGSCPLIS